MRPTAKAWLELPAGDSVPIETSFSIGRANSNDLVLGDDRVSRHHAVIRVSDTDEYWVVDLGSANGTSVNDRRVHAARLRDGDALTIGGALLVFRCTAGDASGDHAELEMTVQEVRQFPAWLFLADIQDSTGITRQVGPEAMAAAYTRWIARCREILDATGGVIDKPLGDGWFAFWPVAERTAADVAHGLADFRRFQSDAELPFRIVLHVGTAFTGGHIASGLYRLFGPDVNFTFRMEGLAKTLGEPCLISDAARHALAVDVAPEAARVAPEAGRVAPEAVGSYPIPGLEGSHPFFRL